MKDKIKRFFIDKKELLVFIAVVVVVFATVITIASLALSDKPVAQDTPVVNEPSNDNPVDDKPIVNDPVTNQPAEKAKFIVPVSGEYEVVRTYYDLALSDEELESAIILTGSYMIESKGLSYAKPKTNNPFDVCAIYEGTVTAVEEDELNGMCVTILHADGIESIYSSLSNVSLKVNDKVEQGQTLGQSASSLLDVEAGIHVHLEVKVNGNFINPSTIFGKEITEIEVGK